jgi:hypothetical protein
MATQCAECLAEAPELLPTTGGESVCTACAEAHYVACGDCKLLAARDETRESDGVAYCVPCFERIFAVEGVESDADVEALVAEYVELAAEAKQLGERLESIKEQLKRIAASKPRVAGSVVLGDGDQTVKCSYRTDYKVADTEKLESLEPLLGADRFAALFERVVSYKPYKDSIESFLSTGEPELREALREAIRVNEVETLTVPRGRKR